MARGGPYHLQPSPEKEAHVPEKLASLSYQAAEKAARAATELATLADFEVQAAQTLDGKTQERVLSAVLERASELAPGSSADDRSAALGIVRDIPDSLLREAIAESATANPNGDAAAHPEGAEQAVAEGKPPPADARIVGRLVRHRQPDGTVYVEGMATFRGRG